MIAANPDTMYVLVGAKGESLHWVNKESLTRTKFEWQDEYTALSVSESGIERVREHITGQEEHHRNKSFAEEYQELLEQHGFTVEGLKSRRFLGGFGPRPKGRGNIIPHRIKGQSNNRLPRASARGYQNKHPLYLGVLTQTLGEGNP
jgi:hypothetical protein